MKGYLVSVGGAEDKGQLLTEKEMQARNLDFFETGILKHITNLLPDATSRIEVVTTASSIAPEIKETYLKAFSLLGFENVGVLDIKNREEANKAENIQRVKDCDCIMFSGGNQLRLSSFFGGTEILDILKFRLEHEFIVVAGTSAGAMAMSNTMIYEGDAELAHLKGEVKITTGLGFIQNVIIDSHFDRRGRFMRLAQAVAANPGAIGIGLGEDTGVIVRDGNILETIGSADVVIIDGRNIGHNNIADAEFGQAISVENLKVHIMERGNTFDLKKRTFEPYAQEPIGTEIAEVTL